MKPIQLLSLLALFVSVASAAPLRPAQVRLRADAPQKFVPRGWKIEKRINGDLNRDKVADSALVLVENKPARTSGGEATERDRALVVLLREGKGWRRAGFNNSLLLNTRGGGAFYGVMETPVTVQISRGVLRISMESGSRNVLNTIHRFRYDAQRRAFLLVGFDLSDRDRAAGGATAISTNFLTGVQRKSVFVVGSDRSKTSMSRVSRRLRTLESVKDDARA